MRALAPAAPGTVYGIKITICMFNKVIHGGAIGGSYTEPCEGILLLLDDEQFDPDLMTVAAYQRWRKLAHFGFTLMTDRLEINLRLELELRKLSLNFCVNKGHASGMRAGTGGFVFQILRKRRS